MKQSSEDFKYGDHLNDGRNNVRRSFENIDIILN